MKKIGFILTFIFSNLIYGNKIDELKTTREVESFIKTVRKDYAKVKSDYDRGNFRIESIDTIFSNIQCDKIFNINEIYNWKKIDINNDGLTDLLFIPHYYGYSQCAIIDKGNGTFKLFQLINNFDACEFIKPIKVKNKNQIWIRKMITRSIDDGIRHPGQINMGIDTLTYKFDAFIELNDKKTEQLDIKNIQIKTDGCFGPCPVLELKIDANGNSEFNGYSDTKCIGKYSLKIDSIILNELKDLISYIEIKKLKDKYSVNWTDDMTVTLKIEFRDGSVKAIEDYGLKATFGLTALYNKLIKIGTETEWK
jgi:hypothetical protein